VKQIRKSKIKAFKFIKKSLNKENLKELARKAGALSLIGKVAAFSLIMATIPATALEANAKNQSNIAPYDSKIAFGKDKTNPVYIPESKKPDIVIGESEFQKNERVAREEIEKQLAMSGRTVVARERVAYEPVDPDLATKRALAKKAASRYGIDWRILEAVWQVESGKAWITPVKSYAGAQGPMQFMGGTWNKYAVDGNGDGVADINNAEDAVYAGANLLAQAGAASGDVDSALLSYNHAQWYVDKVKGIANSITE